MKTVSLLIPTFILSLFPLCSFGQKDPIKLLQNGYKFVESSLLLCNLIPCATPDTYITAEECVKDFNGAIKDKKPDALEKLIKDHCQGSETALEILEKECREMDRVVTQKQALCAVLGSLCCSLCNLCTSTRQRETLETTQELLDPLRDFTRVIEKIKSEGINGERKPLLKPTEIKPE